MCGHETDLGIGVFHTNCHSSFITSHTGHPSLLNTTFDILDMLKNRSPNENTQSGANELSASKENVMLATCCSRMSIQRLPDSLLPSLFPGWVTVHDLLRTELDNLLESNSNYFWLLLRGLQFRT